MDAPNVPSVGTESATELKSRLRAELESARGGISHAAEALREATDLPARMRASIPPPLAQAVQSHPWAIAVGCAALGFFVARRLVAPRRTASLPHPALLPKENKSLGNHAKELLFSSAAYVLKPALKDFATRYIQDRFINRDAGPPSNFR